jgi:hypothetical protein
MLYKFIVENKQTGDKTPYKTLKDIANKLNVEYHQARMIYMESKNPKKFLHPISKELANDYLIYDNPDKHTWKKLYEKI